jgi:photosystem II stability/assembly factor-like uncharacterized protein
MKRSSSVLRATVELGLVLTAACLAQPAPAAGPQHFDPRILDVLVARPLGPANVGGRIVDLAVVEKHPATLYVASASGGLWKTVNNGGTWTPLFDHEATVALGAVAVAPSNPDVVWVGTGEANARNSVSWGDGVYKSTDGGKTWKNMGLRDSAHVGRIVIHPHNPDVVYVAALGHVWAPNKERGLYRTSDGGRTWQQLNFLGEDTGFIDVLLDPADPETVYAAGYHVRRGPFSGPNPVEMCAPEAGLFKSGDGGRTWVRLAAGLPARPLGRCGLTVCRKDPHVLYAVVQTDRTVLNRETEWGQPAHAPGSVETGGVFRSEDRGESWTKVNDLCPRPFYFSQIRVDPADDKRLYVLGVNLHVSSDGGRTFRADGAEGIHADHHALWIDPNDSQHLVLGNDGGLYFSYDRGVTWEHVKNLPLAQFYAVAADLRRPYHVYGGLQDNGSWGGPGSNHNPDGITLADWTRVLGADGFYCQVDPADPDTVYAEAQYGGLTRVNVRTGEARAVVPKPPEGGAAYRFNWSAPLLLSPHNPRTLYFGGNHLFRSIGRGDTWQEVSPDLTRGTPGAGADYGHTITAVAESPLHVGLLYVGTDDGRVHVSRNGGAAWTDLSDRVPGLSPDRRTGLPTRPDGSGEPSYGCVTRLECSHFAEGTAYLAVDRHRQDDRAPYLFRTTDYGTTWKALAGNLPSGGPVLVVREDLRNRNLLFAGTEFGLFASFNGGTSWHPLRAGLPTVAVHDLLIHPRDRDLVIATHGRGLYVLDIAPLEELTAAVLEEDAHLFDVKPAGLFQYHGSHGLTGARTYAAPNPPFGAVLTYYLREKAAPAPRLTVTDSVGNPVAVLRASDQPGLHRVVWDLRATAAAGRTGAVVAPGDYAARLQIGDQTWSKKVHVEAED